MLIEEWCGDERWLVECGREKKIEDAEGGERREGVGLQPEVNCMIMFRSFGSGGV